ncbi:MAG TPA: ATP-binding protein [Ktedonobacterales bacterium]|nr:ATP-binding protein [Ktedonobacterales bacterium]
MTDEQLADLLALPHEQSHVEYKSPARFKYQPLTARVVRAALGMANRRDGGMVIVGIEESQGQINPKGLSPQQLATWVHDHIADEFRRYAGPSIRFEQVIRQYNGNPFVVLTIHEFDDVPVICQKQYQHPGDKQPILRKGAIYVRPRGKPESVEVCTVEDMRDLVDLAADKLLRKHVARNLDAGWPAPGMSTARDADAFAQELAQGWGAHERNMLDKITNRGSWHVVIRPEEYQQAAH